MHSSRRRSGTRCIRRSIGRDHAKDVFGRDGGDLYASAGLSGVGGDCGGEDAASDGGEWGGAGGVFRVARLWDFRAKNARSLESLRNTACFGRKRRVPDRKSTRL